MSSCAARNIRSTAHSLVPVWFCALVGTLLSGARVSGQVEYVEVGAASGILECIMAEDTGASIAASDYDDDGLVDFFVPTAVGQTDQLYRNLGNGQFQEVAASVGLASTSRNVTSLWFDYDGDGDQDLFVAHDVSTAESAYRLYRQNADGQFQDVTFEAGLLIPSGAAVEHDRGGNCAGDINNDGYLDLVAPLTNGPAHVFLNNQDGTFSDISVSSGVGASWQWTHQAMMADFNGDGWLDIYMSIDFSPNLLWINQHDNTFVEVASLVGADNAMNDMGMALGDYDNDGDFDIFVTNIFVFDPISLQWERNILLRNDSVGANLSFSEISKSLGVDYGGFGWGATFLDCNNDGWLDIALTNGWRSIPQFVADPSKLYLSNGVNPLSFSDVSDATGFNDTFFGRSLVTFDYDRDGDLDLLQTCQALEYSQGEIEISDASQIRLLRNELPNNQPNSNYLVVRPRMTTPNPRAIGAVIRAGVAGMSMTRLITAGCSYLGQEPAEAFFGLGSATSVDSLTIDWPNCAQTTLENVAANQVLTVTYGGFADVDADGEENLDDLDCMVAGLSGSLNCGNASIDNLDIHPCGGDGELNLYDLVDLLDSLAGAEVCPSSCP